MSKKIHIDVVDGGDPQDHEELRHSYFESRGESDKFLFFDKQGTEIPTIPSPLTNGTSFKFTKNQLDWTITRFLISHHNASGHWTNDHLIDEDEGSFQAQAGTVEGEESASAAKGSY